MDMNQIVRICLFQRHNRPGKTRRKWCIGDIPQIPRPDYLYAVSRLPRRFQGTLMMMTKDSDPVPDRHLCFSQIAEKVFYASVIRRIILADMKDIQLLGQTV